MAEAVAVLGSGWLLAVQATAAEGVTARARAGALAAKTVEVMETEKSKAFEVMVRIAAEVARVLVAKVQAEEEARVMARMVAMAWDGAVTAMEAEAGPAKEEVVEKALAMETAKVEMEVVAVAV